MSSTESLNTAKALRAYCLEQPLVGRKLMAGTRAPDLYHWVGRYFSFYFTGTLNHAMFIAGEPEFLVPVLIKAMPHRFLDEHKFTDPQIEAIKSQTEAIFKHALNEFNEDGSWDDQTIVAGFLILSLKEYMDAMVECFELLVSRIPEKPEHTESTRILMFARAFSAAFETKSYQAVNDYIELLCKGQSL